VAPRMNRNPCGKYCVGGGTAGWIAPACSRRVIRDEERWHFGHRIESTSSRRSASAKARWPTIRATFEQIGVSETDFLRECDASFKQGSQFVKWVDGSDGTLTTIHSRCRPATKNATGSLLAWRIRGAKVSRPACASDGGLPAVPWRRAITTPEFTGLANYAYHLTPAIRAYFFFSTQALYRQAGCQAPV